MFSNNHILAFIFSILPALIYGYIIFRHSPKNSIQLNKLWVYTIIGFLSITFFNFFSFIFPDFQKPLFRDLIGTIFTPSGEIIDVYLETVFTILFLAFVQVSLLEEISKWAAFKSGDLIRGRNALRDHPYAIMFYTAMVAAGFASIENTEYAIRAIRGVYGEDVSVIDVLTVRSFSSVVMHMTCGIIMGYYIALGAKSKRADRIKFNIVGIFSAVVLHGAYDFVLMYGPISEKRFALGSITIHWPSMILVIIGLALSYFMAVDLKYRKIRKNKIT